MRIKGLAQMPQQQDCLKSIVEEYVDLKSLNHKPLKETLDFLFKIVGEKPVGEYTRLSVIRVFGTNGGLN
jgi:hypothetical protein